LPFENQKLIIFLLVDEKIEHENGPKVLEYILVGLSVKPESQKTVENTLVGGCKELFSHILKIVSEIKLIRSKEFEMSGADYKEMIITKICCSKVQPNISVALSLIRTLLTKKEHELRNKKKKEFLEAQSLVNLGLSFLGTTSAFNKNTKVINTVNQLECLLRLCKNQKLRVIENTTEILKLLKEIPVGMKVTCESCPC
ncbi:Fanconi anemia group I protein, partial [Aphis craccivora]